jgi:PPIC-type PPIASE domain
VKRWLKEPLLHFVLLGAAIFAIDAARSVDAAGGDDRIVVSAGRVENLTALFTKTWQRAPSAQELRGLVEDYVLEEALYREGMALGVDQNDTIIRRRVRQKMEFVVDDIIEQVEPTDDELVKWLAEHESDYAAPARYRFRQLYLNPERHEDSLEEDAQAVLAELRALDTNTDPRGLGDPSLFEHAFPDASVETIATIFGDVFVDGLAELPIEEWSGPVESAFGLHLVHIATRTHAEAPPLDEVRDAVARDWTYAQSEEAAKRYRDGILEKYQIEIEWPIGPEEVQAP